MKTYEVTIKEIRYHTFDVDAKSKEDAESKAYDEHMPSCDCDGDYEILEIKKLKGA